MAREAVGLSVTAFAKRCGWTHQYQSKLEGKKESCLDLDRIEVIQRVLGDGQGV
jgi:hypothetical protein